MSQIFDKTTDALATSLNMQLLKQNVTASNTQNAGDSWIYHAKKMDF